MAKILLQYEADTKQLTTELKKVETANTKVDSSAKKTGATVTDSFTKAGQSVDTAASKTNKLSGAINNVKSSTGGLNNVFGQIAAGIGAAFAVQKVFAFAKASVDAFVDSEAKTQKLKFALENITKDGGAFDKLVKQSEELQDKLKIFDAEDIQAAQAAQAQFGLTAKQIEKLTPLILELSVAQGVDLQSATDTALRSIEGQTKGLKTVGASFEDTGNAIDNFNMLTEKLAKFQGTAAASLSTTNSQLKAQEVELGNIQEAIGEKLSPKVTALKFLFLDLADAGLSALDDLGDGFDTLFNVIKGFSFGGITGATAALTNSVTTDINKLIENAKAANEKLVADYNKSFANLNTTELEKKLDTVENLLSDAKEKRKNATDGIQKNLADQAITELASQVISLNGLIKARQKGIEAEKEYTTNIIGFSKERIQAEIDELKGKTQTSDVQALIKIRKDALDAILKAEKEASEKSLAQKEEERKKQKEKQEKADAEEIKAKEKLEAELLKRESENLPNIVEAINNDTNAKINALKEQYLTIGNFSEEAQKELSDKIKDVQLAGLQLQLAETKAAGQSTIEIQSQIDDILIEKANDTNAKIVESEAAAIEKRKELIQQLFEVTQAVTEKIFGLFAADNETRLAELQARTEAEMEIFNEQQTELDTLRERGAISDREANNRQIELTQRRTAAEKKAAQEQRKLQREAAVAARELAIFEIILNTAKGVVSALGSTPPNPFLAAAIGVTGALELATAVSQPLPKFFKGTSYVERGSNPQGRDTIPAMLHEGERIITTENNRKNWDVYEAIENNDFKKFVQKHYVIPQLRAFKAEIEKRNQKDFAGNIASALIGMQGGITAYEADRIRKKGMQITNSKDLASQIAEAIVDKLPKTYGRW